MDWSAKELTHQTFREEIDSSPYPVFVDFWAAWCPPCRMMDPVIEELAEEFEGKILVRKLNTDLYRTVADKLNINGIPTYVVFRNGEEVWRNVGALSKKKLIQVFSNIHENGGGDG